MIYRDTWAQVDLDKFAHNIDVIKKHTGKEIFCVVKANAYGHGDIFIAKEAISLGCAYIAVSSLDEAIALRKQGVDSPILILGYVNPDDVHVVIKENITMTVVSLDWAERICSKKKIDGLKVHIKVDTGMNRLGIKKLEEIKEAMQMLLEKGVEIEGIYTHFHSADNLNKKSCDRQKNWFYHILDSLNFDFKWIHTANSDTSISYEVERCNAIRPGLALYGIKCVESPLNLIPILSLYTRITCVKKVMPNETIGYGATYKAKKEEWIATLPIGYGDGFTRSNQGRFLCLDGHPCEIVGRVCMDQCMIRLNEERSAGEIVEIIGEHIGVEDMARELKTIPYEILCLFNDRIPRVFFKDKKMIGIQNNRMHE